MAQGPGNPYGAMPPAGGYPAGPGGGGPGGAPPNPDKLSAAQRSKIRRLATPKDAEEGEEAGELNIVPFLDIITNVMMFVLASISVSFTVTIDADAPKGGRGVKSGPQEESLNLTVLILEKGYYVKGRAASIAPGCQSACTGSCDVTVARIAASDPGDSIDGKVYDGPGLTKCVRTLKDKLENDAPQLAAETQVMISANPNVPFQEIVRAMDALRKDDKGDLFPEVVFTVLK